jgi:hypothetical protein
VSGITDPNATVAPTDAASPSAAPPSAGGSPALPAADPNAPAQFAVDLLDVDESRIAPGDTAALTALGTATASPGTGQSPASAERPNARDELWIPIVLVALLLLTFEWLVYERDTLARLRRAIAARLGRRNAPTTGRGA